MPFLFQTTTTAQDVMDSVSQDVRKTLSATDITLDDPGILLDYVNRVSFEMLRSSKWIFLLGPVQQFVTQLGVTDYWIGPNQTGPLSAYDTGLDLVDLRFIAPKSVVDRSNFRTLGRLDEKPLNARLAFTDNTSRPGRPAVWRQDETQPFILNIYPAPDNQNGYAPVPGAPISSRLISGALLDRFYFVALTLVDSLGNESTPSKPTKLFVPANSVLVINPPFEPITASTPGVLYNRYNVYAAQAPDGVTLDVSDLTLQVTGSALLTTSVWTEPDTGLTSGVTPPSENNLATLDGYIVEFRYFRLRQPVSSAAQILQIPDDYRDVIIAGVNALAFGYLTRPQESMRWYQIYKDGLAQIVRDINFMDRGPGYIQTDPSTIGNFLPTVETLDSTTLEP